MSNPISWLNEYSAKNLQCAKIEDEYESSGLAHNKMFMCTLRLSHLRGRGEGKTKKDAKLNAATAIVNTLKSDTTIMTEERSSPSKVGLSKENNKISVSGNIKGSLQELCQKNGLSIPEYGVVKKDGPDHSSQFTIKCVVRDRNGLVVHESLGSNSKKKSAEIEAATIMKQQLLTVLNGGQLPNPPTISSRSGQEAAVPMEQNNSSSNAKSILQELCQKNMLLIPEYKLADKKGPSHEAQFTVTCIVKDSNRDELKMVYGNGTSKKSAEVDAAVKMKREIETMLPSIGIEGSTMQTQTTTTVVSPRGGLEEDTDLISIDELYAIIMSKSFHMPDVLIEQSEPIDNGDPSTMKYLCLAQAQHTDPTQVASSYDLVSYPIASQGIGVTEEEAKREALLNLINNIEMLVTFKQGVVDLH